MEKIVILCVLAAFLYSGEIVVTDNFLSKSSPIMTTFIFGVFLTLFSAPPALITWHFELVKAPSYYEICFIALAAFIGFLADWTHFAALHYGSGSVSLATFYMLIPVICSGMQMKWPSLNILIAWVLGGIALFLVYQELAKEEAQKILEN